MKPDRLIYGIAVILLLLVSCSSPVRTEFTERERNKAVKDLVSRVTSGRQDAFRLKITDVQQDGKDWFSVYSEDGRIVLEGNNGVSVASALNHYLKEYCGWHYTWCGKDTALPATLPLPDGKVTKVSPYKYRYYLNYCTFNYTMSWWDSGRWQQEIDFMALNGINMPLAVTGQNSVWQRVYRKLGFTDKELESFFSGPAYFNWFWMGNLDGWGGPLPQGFMDKHEELQKNILFAERSLGMTPILPAFTGHVPPAFGEKFPDAKIRKTSWVNFPEVSILDPGEDLFTEIGRLFIEEQTKLYGTNHYYTADTFNENTPPTNDSTFLNDISNKVYNSMSEVDPEAVWVMQGWLFYHGRKFWGDNEIRALLGGVPDDRMLILDLWSERFPVWSRTEAYYGKPWIWCMLHNFGQNITLSGNVTSVANDPAGALHDPGAGKMLGIGLTMEGIGQNPAMYALMLENVWRDTPV
ncbi:MAG: alpha-N-acetylglucosaminidase, partial [Bacteroides sp.]|nr:alpha-N-acetylglucosaminidase [Bacteroides sp.]